MTPIARALVAAVLLPLLLVAGCGSGSSGGSSSSSAPPPAASSSAEAVPADPAQSPGDAAPVDTACPASNTTSFAKTKFAAHAGLAFGAFHRYLWAPYQAGAFRSGARGRTMAFIKGGLAALFVKREVRLAGEDAKANPTLCKNISAPLATIGNKVQSGFQKLKSGDTSDLNDVNSSITSTEGAAHGAGTPIQENPDPDIAAPAR